MNAPLTLDNIAVRAVWWKILAAKRAAAGSDDNELGNSPRVVGCGLAQAAAPGVEYDAHIRPRGRGPW